MAHLGENCWGNTPEQLDENTPPDAERKGFFDPGRPDRLVVDGDQIRDFVDAVFRYASPGLFISLRTFRDDKSPDIREDQGPGPGGIDRRGNQASAKGGEFRCECRVLSASCGFLQQGQGR